MNRFVREAQRILRLPVESRVNALGGYGPAGEVVYEAHPSGCPSVLVDNVNNATATFMSNGSVGFLVNLPNGMDVHVLDSHFDIAEKRETDAPSNGLWFVVNRKSKGPGIVSLMNPRNHIGLPHAALKLVKLGDPDRAYWYGATFEDDVPFESAVRLSLVNTEKGPAVLRQVYLKNRSRKQLEGALFTYFNLHGTQRFAYNKEIWYDAGMPVTPLDIVVAARVPYSDILQLKRLSTALSGFTPRESVCDYTSFAGDTAANLVFPDAVLRGAMGRGAGPRLSRFAVPTIAASRFVCRLRPGACAALCQSLLYVTDEKTLAGFRERSSAKRPTYVQIEQSFLSASRSLLRGTPDCRRIMARKPRPQAGGRTPCFELDFPSERAVSLYANSVWTGVKELYENCRAHGAVLADGIEIGTRDRAQDMWPKMKEDPIRVRDDLLHAFSFMYVTAENESELTPVAGRLSLRQKLHGMFPRQYPSRWRDRAKEVMNDNRPYTDSPLWLVDALCMYIRETGDVSILARKVGTVRLTDPDHPETSGIVGHDKSLLVAEVVREIFRAFARHASDSPYGLCQILYGDWCDPVDMFGTSKTGDPSTRGAGKGVQVRLSGHVFATLVDFLDVLESPQTQKALRSVRLRFDPDPLAKFADRLRQAFARTAWENHRRHPAFLNAIHERRADGSIPDYDKGETGYTLGSMKRRDFDGIPRRELTCQAYALKLLSCERPYLTPLPQARDMIEAVLKTVDALFFNDRLGLVLFTVPIGNNRKALELVGRMGMLPSGTAENGEYHHGQVMMHRFRMELPGQTDTAWAQFKPMMSAMRDESIAGPFETPCTSYVSDKDDPHFGKAMYFGLSGSTDWIVEIFQRVAGIELNLHDSRRPALAVRPRMPAALQDTLTFKRIVHAGDGRNGFRPVPLTVTVRRQGQPVGEPEVRVRINGKSADKAELASLKGCRRIRIDIVRRYRKSS